MLLLDRAGSRPGRRPRVWATSKFQPKLSLSRFFCGYARSTGRGQWGQKTLRTKSTSVVKPKFWPIFNVSVGFFSLSLVVSWRIRSLFSSALLVLRSALGAWFCVSATASTPVFAYACAAHRAVLASANPDHVYPQKHWWRPLSSVLPYSLVCCVSRYPGEPAKYARALGSSCRVLIPEVTEGWSLISLPSKRLVFNNNVAFVVPGVVSPGGLAKIALSNAGLSKRLGVASIVRGTVRNPNDHPHGGRSRAIRYPRTPWGKTAKASRAPRLIPRFKVLKKRKLKQSRLYVPYWKEAEGQQMPPQPEGGAETEALLWYATATYSTSM